MDEVDWFVIIVVGIVIVVVAALRMRPRRQELRIDRDEPLRPEDWAIIRTLRHDPDYQLAVDHLRGSFTRANDPFVAPRRLLESMHDHQTDIAGAIMIMTAGSKILTREEREARRVADLRRDEEAQLAAATEAKLEARRRARAELKAERKQP